MTIRPVKISELEILLSIVKQTFIDTYKHLNDPADFQAYLIQNFTLEKLESDFKTVQNNQNVIARNVATEGGCVNNYYFIETHKIIGYLKINVNKSPMESDSPIIYQSNFDYKKLKGIEIERIYVIKDMKGQGIGRFMIEKTIEIARIHNYDYVWLGVWADNAAAIAFYQKMGFTVFGEHTFMMGNDAQKDLLMIRRLSD